MFSALSRGVGVLQISIIVIIIIIIVIINPGVGQNIVAHVSPAATNFFLVLMSTFQVYSLSFPSKFSLKFGELGFPVLARC